MVVVLGILYAICFGLSVAMVLVADIWWTRLFYLVIVVGISALAGYVAAFVRAEHLLDDKDDVGE